MKAGQVVTIMVKKADTAKLFDTVLTQDEKGWVATCGAIKAYGDTPETALKDIFVAIEANIRQWG